MSDLRFVELCGSPATMGEAFGEQFRDEIRGLFEARMNRVRHFLGVHDPDRPFSPAAALEIARGAIGAHQRYDSGIWEEFAGIARGSGRALDELLITNGLTDMQDLVLFDKAAASQAFEVHVDECTALLVPGECGGGQPLLCQTWDMHAEASDYLVIVRRKPDDGPETCGLTTTGCLCLIGLNSEGVGVGNTNLVPTDSRIGVNYLFTLTRALRSRSAAEAADAIASTPRMSGHNFMIVDGRSACNVECTATRDHRRHVRDEPFVPTNHYLKDSLRPLEFQRQIDNSRWRYEKMCGLLGHLPRPITMDACWKYLAEVSQGCVPTANGFDENIVTVATIALCPAAGRFYVCAGAAGSGTRHELKL